MSLYPNCSILELHSAVRQELCSTEFDSLWHPSHFLIMTNNSTKWNRSQILFNETNEYFQTGIKKIKNQKGGGSGNEPLFENILVFC